MNIPKVSLIIPTHRRAGLLRRALNSINAQSYRNLIEVIVISDVIDTGTEQCCGQLLRDHDVFVRRNGTPGPSASRNQGLKLATGNYIMFLDDDDAWDDEFFRVLFEGALNHRFSSMYFDCRVVKESRLVSGPVSLSDSVLNLKDCLNEFVFLKNQIHMSCFMFSKHLLDGLFFDENMRAYEDWDFLLGVFEREMPTHVPIQCSVIYEVDDVTSDRRGSSEDATNFNAVLDYLYVYRRHPAPSAEVQHNRKKLLSMFGLNFEQHLI